MFRTFSKGVARLPMSKFTPPNELTVTDGLRPDLGPVHDDINQGAPARATVVGPARALNAGERVIVGGSASAPGVVALEVSTDGGNGWSVFDSDSIPAGEYLVGIADVPAEVTHYRVSFTAGGVAASKVFFSTQARD